MALYVINLILQINPPQTPLSTYQFKQLSRDENILVGQKTNNKQMEIKENLQTYGLRENSKSQTQISAQFGTSRGQVSYSLGRGISSVKKSKRPSPTLKADDFSQILSYV